MNSKIILLLLLLLFYLTSIKLHALPYQKPLIQHGADYHKQKNKNIDISQYYISEKLDGMRGYWNGKNLQTRQGNPIITPLWFTQGWPDIPIDGELWISRDNFQALMSCVRKAIAGTCWRKVNFMIFDLPHNQGSFTERVKTLQDISIQTNSPYLKVIKQYRVSNLSELEEKLTGVIDNKGEGLMLHLASAHYQIGRTSHLLKLKRHQDAEAVIIEHLPGKGKYQYKLGAVKVKTAEGVIFKIGSGFSDKERSDPPAVGSIITYRYNGFTKSGKPRFARFWRVRQRSPSLP